MYKLHIQHEVVRMNVALIIDAIRRQRLSKETRQKTLSLVINRHTGKMQLLPAGPEEDYKLIELHLKIDTREAFIEEKGAYKLDELDKKSQHVLAETCHCLKLALGHLHDIRELAHLEFEPSLEKIKSRNLLHEAWHAVVREDAERILLNTTPGTYLFRKDHYAGCLEEILGAAKKKRIKCCTLTYLDPKGQVRDRTIVCWEDHWMFYDDNPTLIGSYYSSLEELLISMGTLLKRPLEALSFESAK